MARIMESDEEYLDRVGGDGTPEGNFALADGYNRMANAEVEAYNSRPAPADWNGALRHQEEQNRVQEEQRRNAAMAEQIGANRGVYDGYVQMGNAVSSRRAQYINNANAHLASALRIAAENGGKLPQYSWQGLGGALGLDGKNGAIIGGGYDRKGGFTLMVARRNQQTGQVEQVPMSFSPRDQYGLMVSAPGIFSRQEVDGMRGQLINNFHMHPDQVPQVPQGWGETGNVGIGNRTATGGTSVNPNWLYGPQRRSSISAFGADVRGGFTQYDSNEDTGYRLQSRDSGTRAPEDKGRWKVLSSGSHGDGQRGTRYENDKTGEVVFVPEGETLESVTRGMSDKERVAQIQEEGRNSRAAAQNETKLSIADLTAQLKQQGYEVDEKKLAEAVRHNQATESQQAENEKGRRDRAKQNVELRKQIAEMKQSGTIGGRLPTTHEYVEALRFANDLMNDERDRKMMREHATLIGEALKKRGEKLPDVSAGKAEVKTGDNGGGDDSESTEYPGYSNGKARRAIAAGWTWNKNTKRFEPPRK